MSHKATNWLAEIEPPRLSASEFRVLFHLCDCHNASAGCFPSQAYLIDRTGASNGTVNNALNALEQKGLIQRHRSRDGKTKRQRPTRYILGFEITKPQEPSPISGDGNSSDPSPISGGGAVSNSGADPSPISGPTRLQPTGEEPVSNQKITFAGVRAKASDNPMVDRAAQRAVERFRSGHTDAFNDQAEWVIAHILGAKMLTKPELQGLGFAESERKAG